MSQSRIRNFCIVAHIDHGKSTLADRLIEATGAVEKRQMREQLLDTMDLERERGITIKLNAVRMSYTAADGTEYELNLIDTPGHVDFTYEVSRSLAACEGAILVVDASQGVQAQTLSNLFLAMDAGLEIIPVLNKIDLPGAEPEKRAQEIMDLIGAKREEILAVSAKEGTGVPELLEAIVARVPPPRGTEDAPLRALIFDSYYDRYRGAIPSIRVVDGVVREGMEITFGAHPDDVYQVDEVGYLQLGQHPGHQLEAGEVGYLVASLRDALEKLGLNDASYTYEPETSGALGFGFRCGFLGLLHMEIIRERLEREFDLELIATAPSVIYRVHLTDGTMIELHNPADMPEPQRIAKIEEPWIEATILVPDEHLGAVLKLCEDRRGRQKTLTYAGSRAMLVYYLPLNEVVFDFYDRLKSVSRGYASFDYHITGYEEGDLVKMSLLVNAEPVDALSVIVNRARAETRGRAMVDKLKDLIPRHMFKIPIQAAIGGKVIARETISALRKDVTAKCYGGDITRKRKLLEKQKAGKKRMRSFGKVDIPQEAFIAALKMDAD